MPNQTRSIETRDRILQAALTCFSHSGFDASGVAEICSQAGVSKGAFYHHFPTKQAVFLELQEQWLARLDNSFAEIRHRSGSVPDALRAMARASRPVFADARGQLSLFLEFWTQATRDPLVWQHTMAPYQRYLDLFAGLLQAGVNEGSLRPVDARCAAHALISMALGLLVQAMMAPDSTDWPDAASQGIELFLKGIEK